MATKRTSKAAVTKSEPEIIEYGLHGVDAPAEKGTDNGMAPQGATEPTPFEIEVGSPVWERLAEEGKLGPDAAERAAALKAAQDEEDAELVE